jgi:hypothetical protein
MLAKFAGVPARKADPSYLSHSMKAPGWIALATASMLAGCAGIQARNPILGGFTAEARGDTTVFLEAYQSGGIRSETPLIGGNAEGSALLFHPDGRLERRTVYRAGQFVTFDHDSEHPGEWSYDSSGRRPTVEILKVIRRRIPGLRQAYNHYMYPRRLTGKLTLVFAIRPDGYLHYLIPIGDTTRHPEFAVAVLNSIKDWKFVAVLGRSLDIVTIPFTFSP